MWGEALAAYPVPVLVGSITQRVVFAEAAPRGPAVQEIDDQGPAAAEIEAVTAELMESARDEYNDGFDVHQTDGQASAGRR